MMVGADVWQDYLLLIPASQFDSSSVLDVQGIDLSSQFIKMCGTDHFHVECVH